MTDELAIEWVKNLLGPDQVLAIEAEVASRVPPAESTL
jgi:hypothetical protein